MPGAPRRAEERDFFQGLVHVAVAWYQAAAADPSRPGGSSRRQRGGSRPSRRPTVESTSTACSLSSQRRRPASRQARSTSSLRGCS